VNIVVTKIVPNPLRGKFEGETMISGLEVLNCMAPRLISTTAQSSAYQAYPDILLIVALITLHFESLRGYHKLTSLRFLFLRVGVTDYYLAGYCDQL
jgi:hypothetical protein